MRSPPECKSSTITSLSPTLSQGAGTNSAYVIARDGTIAARQQWFEPTALKRYIDQAALTPNPPAATPRAGAASN